MKAFLILDKKSRNKGFTLIEMIGVLAVIAILASLLIPKIFEAINNSRISNAAVSYNTVKTALADHFAKFGSLNSSNGVAFGSIPGPGSTNFDMVLLAEGFLDKPFQVKIGDVNTSVQVVNGLATGAAVDTVNAAFDLDGSGGGNKAGGSTVVEAIITGVSGGDAFALSTLIDGPSLSVSGGGDDKLGRVKYASNTVTTVYVYVTHR